MEIWRDIPGLVGFYQASSEGRIRSVDRMVQGKGRSMRLAAGRVLKHTVNTRYAFIKISVFGELSTGLVHRLVCAAFHGPPPSPRHHAAHRDGNRQNNRSSNLRWATAKENCEDRERHGTWAHGEGVNTNKLSEADILTIKTLAAAGEPRKAIALHFRVHRSSIDQMLRGDTWRHLKK